MVAFGSGSTPRLPDDPTPTNNAPLFGSIASPRFWWPWTMPNTPFLVSSWAPYAPGTGLRWSGGTSAAFCAGCGRPGLRRREIGGIDMEAVADFVLDREILRRVGFWLRPAGWQAQRDRRQRGNANQQEPEFFGHGLLPGPRARERNATITPQNRILPAELRI